MHPQITLFPKSITIPSPKPPRYIVSSLVGYSVGAVAYAFAWSMCLVFEVKQEPDQEIQRKFTKRTTTEQVTSSVPFSKASLAK